MRFFIILTLVISLIGCNSEEYAKEKRKREIENYMSNLGVPFAALSEFTHHPNIASIKQDSTALDLSDSTYKQFEEFLTARNEFENQVNTNLGKHEIVISSLTPDALVAYKKLLQKLRKFATAYQSLSAYVGSFQNRQGQCVTALLNDWEYMNRSDFSWVFYFDERCNLKSYRNFGNNTIFFLDKNLNTKYFLDLVETTTLKLKSVDSKDPLSIVNSIAKDSVPFILCIERPTENESSQSIDFHLSKPKISRTYYDLSIGNSTYSSTIKRMRRNGFKIIDYYLGNDVRMYAVVKKYIWNGISWDELDLYFKENRLVGIAFAMVCDSETKAKHYLERVSNIYKEKYKKAITESSPDYLYFDDGEIAMEIYGGVATMYLRICETSVADDL